MLCNGLSPIGHVDLNANNGDTATRVNIEFVFFGTVIRKSNNEAMELSVSSVCPRARLVGSSASSQMGTKRAPGLCSLETVLTRLRNR